MAKSDTPVLGELEHLILLAVLRLGGDAYGLSIARELEACAGRRLSRGALYTMLDRLDTKGLVRWRTAAGGPERQGLPKRVYTVTPRGIAALRATQRVLRRMWRGLEDVLKESS
jgi:DNA-binding PadR family transcriptional regulator